jgi:hypothetical protein
MTITECVKCIISVVAMNVLYALKSTASIFFFNRYPHASAVTQGDVVRGIAASYEKSLNSALYRNQTPSHKSTKNGIIHYVGCLKKGAIGWIRAPSREI